MYFAAAFCGTRVLSHDSDGTSTGHASVINMFAAPLFMPDTDMEFFAVSYCFPALIILLFLAYVIIKEWRKRH